MKKLIFAKLLVALFLMSTSAYAIPRPGAGRAADFAVSNASNMTQFIQESGLSLDGVTGEALYRAVTDGKISAETLWFFLNPNLDAQYRLLCSSLLKAVASETQTINTSRFSTPSNGSDSSSMSSALQRMMSLGVDMVNGRQSSVNAEKVTKVADTITNYNQGSKTPVELEAAKTQARDTLNEGASEDSLVVRPDEDPYEVVKNCR